jgi:WW domain
MIESSETVDAVSGGTAGSHVGIDPAKAQVLEALLQELSFWEPPISAENAVLRKSRSVNDVINHSDRTVTANLARTGLTHATSCGGGSGYSSTGIIHHQYPQETQTFAERNEAVTAIEEDVPVPASPTLAGLQALCFWNKAIDPSTGRTYYYDIRTRQTQWEKVRKSCCCLL